MIVDLFAGPGGWSEGLRMLGLSDIGIELDAAACATRSAARHRTIRADVTTYPTAPFVGKTWGLIASPPCQDFSVAGKMAGRTGEKGQLIDDVPRWVDDLRPEWVALEQVPPALEVWQEFAFLFRSWGYSVWCGILNAADYGVPQTRKRAILVASRVRPALPPLPTHERNAQEALFDTRLPWVSMAQALGWTSDVGFPRLDDTGTSEDGYRERDWRSSDEPAFALTEKARSWVRRERSGDRSEEGFDPDSIPAQTLTSKARSWTVRTGANTMKHNRNPEDVVPYERLVEEPSPTVDGKAGHAWTFHRPATTVCADPRLSPPGYRGSPEDYAPDGTFIGERSMDNAIKLTPADALTLQSFPPCYPVQGSRTKQFEQIGNAVPPLLAAHVIGAITGRTMEATNAA
jgi:DNA (cytosine-5)-methyltransferase 1